ncbi:hypothetical protein [Micromonospora sp. LH3U1]|uniref:hypothetical protein n=1 Tax=Micromonospora sp. LH3U1 TaxID=3018339 RepID=UPI00234B769F|nr:hypothetical protein [Micromonospora sp. LH3U1]WCN80954.1 hypothetical protein PCA76_29385 [Micromonospora sp. LH3U1]
MSDIDPRLRDRFAAYRTETIARITGPGPDQARRTLRRRRRTTVVAVAAAAIALAVAPIVANAALRDDGSVPAPAETGEPTTTPTSDPAPTPSVPLAPSTTTTTSPAAPDGRISRAQLLGTPVTLPAWRAGRGCPTSAVRITADDREGANWLLALDHGDVDGDGAVETVALVQCVLGSGGPMQVVAFDRDEKGKLVTLGRVVATTIDKPQWLFTLDVADNGTVRVQVGDIAPGGGWRSEWSQRQWRGYRWKGDAFAQVSGPTSFGTNKHDVNLVVASGDLVLTEAPDGSRTGTVTVRIRNGATGPAAYVGLRLGLPAAIRPDGDGWAACRNDPATTGEPVTCDLNRLEGGKELRLTLGFRVAAGATVGTGKADVAARPMDATFDFVEEVYEVDNSVTITYR